MSISKSLLAIGAITTIGTAGLFASANANAQGTGQGGWGDKIANKFNINKDDIKKDTGGRHTARHQAKAAERLNQAVKDGKITEEQKAKILAKWAELKSFRETLKDKDLPEKQAAIKAKHAELAKWAQDNNIDLTYIKPMQHPARADHKYGHPPENHHQKTGTDQQPNEPQNHL